MFELPSHGITCSVKEVLPLCSCTDTAHVPDLSMTSSLPIQYSLSPSAAPPSCISLLCLCLSSASPLSHQVFHISVGFSKDQLSEVKLFLSKVCVCMCVCSVDQHVPEVKSSVSKITRRGVLLPYSQCSVHVCLAVCFTHQEIVKCMRRKRERAVLGVKHKS